ncbi:MAG: hypothetical protein CR985_04155 [Flavobacteriales bacterium]|nr:MAG: hypothetical protein CR985_04155 [Flavobacteriales bacterium]
MKKVILLVAVLFSVVIFSQRNQKGIIQVNGGIGVVPSLGILIHTGADYGITNDITGGVQLSYATSTSKSYNIEYDETWVCLGFNANYHFNNLLQLPNEFDTYAGTTLAYSSLSYNYPSTISEEFRKTTPSPIRFGLQVGGRYFFTDNIAVNAELGGGTIKGTFKTGITFRF